MKFEEFTYGFIKALQQFEHDNSYRDLFWKLIFPDKKGKWQYVHVTKDQKLYYISHIDGNTCSLDVQPKKHVKVMDTFGFSRWDDGSDNPERVWTPLITSALNWLKTVKKDWIKANKLVQANYPLNRRTGIAPNSLIRASLSDIHRIDKEIGKAKCRKFTRLVEEGYFFGDENKVVKTMTANGFFDYCRIAYIAGKRKDDHVDESLSGREMYKRYADMRHEGLIEIKGDSKKEFADWIDGKHPKKSRGGHPWEIKRGGNTTHISLYVSRPNYYDKEGFKIVLNGMAITRLAETVNMFLAIQEAGLPISISNPEGVRKRLLAQDNIGIIPCYDSLHRANQNFPEAQHVYDVLYYDELGRYKRRITPFITWEPLPVLKPKEI